MASRYMTPGVYITEKEAFPNSVVQVATAVPAFIGYTEKAESGGKSLRNTPFRITSFAEFAGYFGGPQRPVFRVKPIDPKADHGPAKAFSLGGEVWSVSPAFEWDQMFLLEASIRLFYQNGGSTCYVVSVGGYEDGPIAADALSAGIDTLLKQQEPTMVVVPDAVHLSTAADCYAVQQHALQHCGQTTRSRIAILDIYHGDRKRDDPAGDPIQSFRDAIGADSLDYAAAYYPWLETNVYPASDITYADVDAQDLSHLLLREGAQSATVPSAVMDALQSPQSLAPGATQATLMYSSKIYPQLMAEVLRQRNTLPPAAAMAGIYTLVDNNRGVWKAPANVGVNSVIRPVVAISSTDQEDLNVPLDGKAVNAIRTFVGEGVLVWGARTLNGNSLDWRYINVRRTMIMIEESIRLAAKAYVFEPNTSVTWVTLKSMITNFLTDVWKGGGLAGAKPEDAFSIQCGLGETMTADDILEGILRLTVLVAITHPAEFIEITFQQQMQKS